MPVFDKSKREDGTFSRSDFAYDHGADAYTCPAGKTLVQSRRAFQRPEPAFRATTRPVTGPASATARAAPEDQVLPRPALPEGAAVHPRGRPGQGARHRPDGRLPDLHATAEKGGDALRPPQTHRRARPAAPARPERCQRRVSPRRHRPEPAQARQAPRPAPTQAGLRGSPAKHGLLRPAKISRLFQRNRSEAAIRGKALKRPVPGAKLLRSLELNCVVAECIRSTSLLA